MQVTKKYFSYQLHHIIEVNLEHVDALAEILPPTVLSPVPKNTEVTELLLFDQVRLAQKRETSVLKKMKYGHRLTNSKGCLFWREKGLYTKSFVGSLTIGCM